MITELLEKNESDKARILIYGEDGAGKTGFACSLCKDKGRTIVIDFEKTAKPLVDKFYGYDVIRPLFFDDETENYDVRKTLKSLKMIVSDIEKQKYDNVIVDGISKLLQICMADIKVSVGDKNSFTKYGKRADRFLGFTDDLLKKDVNIIFVGQYDFYLKAGTTEVETSKGTVVINNSSRSVREINAQVNNKYLLEREGNQFIAICEKNRLEVDKVGVETTFIKNGKFLEEQIMKLDLIEVNDKKKTTKPQKQIKTEQPRKQPSEKTKEPKKQENKPRKKSADDEYSKIKRSLENQDRTPNLQNIMAECKKAVANKLFSDEMKEEIINLARNDNLSF